MKKWSYLLSYTLVPMYLLGFFTGGWTYFLVPIFVFGVLPAVDLLVGPNATNPNTVQASKRKKDLFFDWVLWLFVPIQWGVVIWGAYQVAAHNHPWWGLAGMVLSAGIITGATGITVAHELGHRSNRRDRFLSKLMLVAVNYGHFFIEHNQGHHAQVATPLDPASARLGESLFAFLPRTLWGSYRHAWHLESRRLGRKEQSFWSPGNQMLVFGLLSIGLSLAFYGVLGWKGLAFFLIQSIFAVVLLEVVNYIEHYGLTRAAVGEGRYEKVNPTHSWNADEYVTNCFLFELQRHSDHHAFPNRPYQILRSHPESPKLPTGYGGMILLAFFPPIWHRVMDPLANEYNTQMQA